MRKRVPRRDWRRRHTAAVAGLTLAASAAVGVAAAEGMSTLAEPLPESSWPGAAPEASAPEVVIPVQPPEAGGARPRPGSAEAAPQSPPPEPEPDSDAEPEPSAEPESEPRPEAADEPREPEHWVVDPETEAEELDRRLAEQFESCRGRDSCRWRLNELVFESDGTATIRSRLPVTCTCVFPLNLTERRYNRREGGVEKIMDRFSKTLLAAAAEAGLTTIALSRHAPSLRRNVHSDDQALMLARCQRPEGRMSGERLLLLSRRRIVVTKQTRLLSRVRVELDVPRHELETVRWSADPTLPGVELSFTVDQEHHRFWIDTRHSKQVWRVDALLGALFRRPAMAAATLDRMARGFV